MIGQIRRCDVCGADHSDENPILTRLTSASQRQPTYDHSPFRMVFAQMEERVRETTLDLCNDCAGPLLGMLQERARSERINRRLAERQAKRGR